MNSETKLVVLVLEVCQPIANNLKAIIERYYPRFEVKICANGEEVIAKIGDSEIFLIISVLEKIGEINGLELLDQVKREAPQTKFIVMAGDDCNITETKERGADGFLAKPFTLDTLHKTIGGIIN